MKEGHIRRINLGLEAGEGSVGIVDKKMVMPEHVKEMLGWEEVVDVKMQLVVVDRPDLLSARKSEEVLIETVVAEAMDRCFSSSIARQIVGAHPEKMDVLFLAGQRMELQPMGMWLFDSSGVSMPRRGFLEDLMPELVDMSQVDVVVDMSVGKSTAYWPSKNQPYWYVGSVEDEVGVIAYGSRPPKHSPEFFALEKAIHPARKGKNLGLFSEVESRGVS